MQAGVSPWAGVAAVDYAKLFEEFGIEPIGPIMDILPDIPSFMRRKIVIGHRDFLQVAEAIRDHRKFYVMTGFMPSGHPHLGHLILMRELAWYTAHGGSGYVAIADREAHAVRGTSWEDCVRYGKEYLTALYALGFTGKTYFQSRNNALKDLAFEAGIRVNFSDLSAIYGFGQDTSLGHAMSVITQVADILYPQVDAGPAPTVVPVGVDQDPHIRLTRDVAHKMRMFTVEDRGACISVRSKNAPSQALAAIAARFPGSKKFEGHVDIIGGRMQEIQDVVREVERSYGGYAFYTPSSTYPIFIQGLQGGKMSSSVPESLFTFWEEDQSVKKKVMNALTGGRATMEEQKRLGGEPSRCPVFQLNLFHMVADEGEITALAEACSRGELLCGRCKKETYERVHRFLTGLRDKMGSMEHLVEQ
jgi:tryptophanyl-tRNA synthetase